MALWLGVALALPLAVRAAEAPPKTFHLPAGDALATLKLFVDQSGEQVVYFVDRVRGVRTRPVDGLMKPLTALQFMLDGTRLRGVRDERTGALSVVGLEAETAAAPASAAAPAAPPRSFDASESSDSILKLPQFSVSGIKADPYRPSEAISAVRIRGPLLDTPLSINVITRELLDDIGANSMYEATRYFSGVSNGRGTGPGGIMDRQDFRGFESFTKTVDNFSSQLIPTNNGFVAVFEPQFVDRAEVVLGPDSILSPTGSPGGSMNIITKSPQFQADRNLIVAIGNYNAGKATLDATGPMGDGDWAYRVIGDYQDGRTYLPGSIREWDVSTQLSRRFRGGALLVLKYFGIQWELTGAMANANDNGWEVSAPGSVGGATIGNRPPAGSGFTYDGWNGNATWSHTFDRLNILSAQLTAPVSGRVNMRLGAEVFFDNNTGDSAYPSAVPTEVFDSATGQVSGLVNIPDPTALKTVARYNHALARDEQVQNDFAGNFQLGPASVQPVAGWSYQRADNGSNTRQLALAPANLFAGVYDPPKPPLSSYGLSAKSGSDAWQGQVYALARTGLAGDRVLLTTGVSRTWVGSDTDTYNVASPSSPPSALGLDGHRDTYVAGLLVKPAPNASVYYTYSSNAALTTSVNQPLWQQGQQNEFGVKTEFFDQRLAFTAAHFQINQTNVVTPNPLYNVDPARFPPNTLSDLTNRGYELNLVGGLTPNLSVISSLTRMKFRDPFGRRVRNVPDTLANLLLNYRFLSGPLRNLSVFGGAVHVGRTAGENPQADSRTGVSLTPLGVPTQVGYYVAAWTVYNAGATYRLGRYRFSLNVDNLLDSKFAWQPASRLSVSPYPGATFRFTTDLKF